MNLVKLALSAEQFTASQPPIAVEPLQCLRARDKSAGCDRCARVCPAAAITLDGGVRVEADACIRCGLCLHVCPTGALSGSDNTHRLLFCVSQLVDRETVEIACAFHPNPTAGDAKVDAVVTTTGCLAALDVSTYLSLAANGVKRTCVRLDACAQCPLAPLQLEIEAAIRQASDLLTNAGVSRTVVVAPLAPKPKRRTVYSAKNPPISRRGFFQALGQHGRDLLPSLEGESARVRLIEALRALKPKNPGATVPAGTAAAFAVSDACNACTTCARICPTGALEFARNESSYALAFSASKCIDCGLCLKYCEPNALERRGAPTLGEFISADSIVLHTGALNRCRKCRTLFAGQADSGLCPVCAYRRKRPFGAVPAQSPRPDDVHSES